MAKPPTLRLRMARAILGSRAKEFIPSLDPDGGLIFGGVTGGRSNQYLTKWDQLQANVGWCFTANNAIAEPFSAIELKLYHKTKSGDREEIKEHEILELLDAPNLALTGEQMRQLHCTYMNFTGESYLYMRDGAKPFEPGKGRLPDAIDVFPSHRVSFKLGDTYTSSTVQLGGQKYPITSFIRDINPDPNDPYHGRSIVTAASLVLDMEDQMKKWNQGVFSRGGHPSVIVRVKDPMSDEVYQRFRKQIDDEVSGTENAHRPLIVEGEGDASPYMMSAKDLDFLQSRKFSKDEIMAMWRVSPGLVGMTENVNRSNLDGAFYINAVINLVPRIRQYVRQVNATLVRPFDPLLELDFVSPVPEDVDQKIKYAEKANGNWLTIDESRGLFGEEPLANGLGNQIYRSSSTASLSDIADGSNRTAPPAGSPDPTKPNGKALSGVKKKT